MYARPDGFASGWQDSTWDDSSDGMDDGMMRGQGQRQLAGGCA